MTKIIPGFTVYEYLLVLQPPEELSKKINKVKQEFADAFETSFSFPRPNISLVKFSQYGTQEEKIVNRLHTISMSLPPVLIEMRNFGSFPNHSIYINIETKLPVTSLVKKIRTEAQRLMKLNAENKPHFLLDPYISLAGKLKPWQYEKGWLQYQHKNFTGRFIADGMLLLKRKEGERNYQVLKRLAFENLSVDVKQASLF